MGTQAETELEFFFKEMDESRMPNYTLREPVQQDPKLASSPKKSSNVTSPKK